jgi:hypothetical protein
MAEERLLTEKDQKPIINEWLKTTEDSVFISCVPNILKTQDVKSYAAGRADAARERYSKS